MESGAEIITYGNCPDVTFVFKNSERSLAAEKLKLGEVSDVFRKQFSTDFDNNERIKIDDIPYDIFDCLLKFIYDDQIEISENNYEDILYASTKYLIYQLIEKVIEFVLNYITSDNLVDVFVKLDKYDIQRVNDHIYDVCITDPINIIQQLNCSKGHMDILKMILESRTLNCSEYELYVAVVKMLKKGLVDAIDVALEMRKKLGNKLIRLIRFPVMTIDQLILCGESPSLLTGQQILDVQLWIKKKIHSDTMQFFSTKPRKVVDIDKLAKKCPKCSRMTYYFLPGQQYYRCNSCGNQG